jgi:hypothetical protein
MGERTGTESSEREHGQEERTGRENRDMRRGQGERTWI